MSWQDLQNYDYFTQVVEQSVSLAGYPSTVYIPKIKTTLGYENLGSVEQTKIGVSEIANQFSAFTLKAFFLFNPSRSVFYKYHLDPMEPDNKDLIFSTFEPNDILKEECFVKTSVVGYPSPWGVHYLKVVKVVDTGIYRTLNRNYFLRVVSDSDLIKLLEKIEVKPYGA